MRFDNSGESGPPCGVPSSVGPTSPSASTPAVKKPRIQPEDAPISHPLGHQPHQNVMVHPVEEFLQVDIHNIAIACGDVGLRHAHRPVRRAARAVCSEKLGSQSACSTCSTASWIKR